MMTRKSYPQFAGRRALAAFSLLELLICVAIVAILAAISINTYQGAFDQQELKLVLPQLAKKLDGLREEAAEQSSSITVKFVIGESKWEVTRRKGSEATTSEEDIHKLLLVQRSLKFLRYEWPDGASEPAEFTFVGSSKPQGGKAFFGTSRADGAIIIAGDRVYYELSS